MKEFLSRENIAFDERVVTENRQYYEELVEGLGFTSVPVTVFDGETVVGFDPGRIRRLLEGK